MAQLRLYQPNRNLLRVDLTGFVGAEASALLIGAEMAAESAQPSDLHIDLGDADALDSVAITTLVRLRETAESNGREFLIIRVAERAARILELAGFRY
jgi:anti-anti-sigma factor